MNVSDDDRPTDEQMEPIRLIRYKFISAGDDTACHRARRQNPVNLIHTPIYLVAAGDNAAIYQRRANRPIRDGECAPKLASKCFRTLALGIPIEYSAGKRALTRR